MSQSYQALSQGLLGAIGPLGPRATPRAFSNWGHSTGEPIEYPSKLDPDNIKKICRRLDNPKHGGSQDVQYLLEQWTFNALTEHAELRKLLLNLILMDESMKDLHLELWQLKNSQNKNHHKKLYNNAIDCLAQQLEDYEIMRRLIAPEANYLIYDVTHCKPKA